VIGPGVVLTIGERNHSSLIPLDFLEEHPVSNAQSTTLHLVVVVSQPFLGLKFEAVVVVVVVASAAAAFVVAAAAAAFEAVDIVVAAFVVVAFAAFVAVAAAAAAAAFVAAADAAAVVVVVAEAVETREMDLVEVTKGDWQERNERQDSVKDSY
jgi:hypothetical protein